LGRNILLNDRRGFADTPLSHDDGKTIPKRIGFDEVADLVPIMDG
jgi:hypothetical protein